MAKAQTVYIKLMSKKHPDRWVHVPVCKGQYVTNKQGFVIPMREHNGCASMHVDILESDFTAPRVLP